MAWIPWDADEAEIEDLQVVREPIPESMRPALIAWLNRLLSTGAASRTTAGFTVNAIQTALRIHFNLLPGDIYTRDFVDRISIEGDKFALRVVDFLLSGQELDPYGNEPDDVVDLRWHLDASASAVRVESVDGIYRIQRRLPDGVDDAAQISVGAANANAGAHLAKALREVHSLEPDSGLVMTEAIRAVEAAAGQVVIPRDQKPTMGKIVDRLKSKRDWKLTLQRRDDGRPDHQEVVIGMMETLVFAEQHRHSGTPPTQVEAQTHALLASTLVGWFATGAVVMDPK